VKKDAEQDFLVLSFLGYLLPLLGFSRVQASYGPESLPNRDKGTGEKRRS
jgi:hypothetical protein